jgi:hypothetical protein
MRYSLNVPDGWSVEQEQKYDYDLMMSAQNQTLCVGVIAEEPNYGSIETFVANAQEFHGRYSSPDLAAAGKLALIRRRTSSSFQP